MKFRSRNKVKPDFSLASMTDLIFLLLIFFMLTSNLVTPSAFPVNLPQGDPQSVIEIPTTTITISKEGEYYYGEDKKPTSLTEIEARLARELKGSGYVKGGMEVPVVVLKMDKESPVEHLVKVGTIANKLGAKTSLATEVTK